MHSGSRVVIEWLIHPVCLSQLSPRKILFHLIWCFLVFNDVSWAPYHEVLCLISSRDILYDFFSSVLTLLKQGRIIWFLLICSSISKWSYLIPVDREKWQILCKVNRCAHKLIRTSRLWKKIVIYAMIDILTCQIKRLI